MKTMSLGLFGTILCLAIGAFAQVYTTDSRQNDPCAKTCSLHADCGTGAYCNGGFCQYKPLFCQNELWAIDSNLTPTSCGQYKCNEEVGTCRTESLSSEDCTSGYVFDGVSACVPSVKCNEEDPDCQDLIARWSLEREIYEKSLPEPKLPPYTCPRE